VPLVPKASIAALLSGEVVAAAVPVGGLNVLDGVVETVGRFGIAADGESMSVLLFSRVPFDAMHVPEPSGLPARRPPVSACCICCLGTPRVHRLPHLATDGRDPDGELLIGDRALVKGQTSVATCSLAMSPTFPANGETTMGSLLSSPDGW
jgi:hypothetical protein